MIIEIIKNEKSDSEKVSESTNELVEKIEAFFSNNRKWIEHYAEDASFSIENGRTVGIDTFAIDLEKRIMYFDPKFWVENGYKNEDAVFGTLHEMEHLRELLELLSKKGGERVLQRHRKSIKEDRSYSILDNCFDDIKMNRNVLDRAPALASVPERLYKEKLFPEDDMTKLPKHLQFSYALVRDSMIKENALISQDVREEIDKLRHFVLQNGEGLDLLNYYSSPERSMAERVEFQENVLRPILKRFKEEDKNNPDFEKKPKGKPKTSEEDKKMEGKEESETGEGQFDEYYEDYEKKNPKPKEFEGDMLDEIVQKIIEKVKNDMKSPKEIAEEAYAKKEGVTKEDLQRYREFKKELEEIIDPETNRQAMEEIRDELKRIVKERLRVKLKPKIPAEEGYRLVYPADAIVGVKSGELNPKVWETYQRRENKEQKVSKFDLHLVADCSGSMASNGKYLEQRKAVALTMEAIQELYEDLLLEEPDVESPLSIRNECLTFGSGVESVKPLGEGLTEKERVEMYKKLGETPGSTKDYLALEKILIDIDKKTEEEIVNGDRLKLVIVTTDGESDSPETLKEIIKKLRDKGVVVIGVGVTKDGQDTVLNYAPDGFLIENASMIAVIYKRILNKYLKDL